MSLISRLILTWLIAVMVLTSGAMALSRSAPNGQTIVICTGSDVKTITLDQNGNEIASLPHCPDCIFLKAILGGSIAISSAPMSFSTLSRLSHPAALRLTTDITADARGPPRTSDLLDA